MRRLAAFLAAVTAIVGAAGFAFGSPPQPKTGSYPMPSANFWSALIGHQPSSLAAAWAAGARHAANSGHPFAEVGATSTPSAGHVDSKRVIRSFGFAGDLNGDRRSDVVDVAQTLLHSNVWGDQHDHYDITAYSGRTGAHLWTTRVTPPNPTCTYQGCKYLYRLGDAFATSLPTGPAVELLVLTVVNDGPANTFDPTDPTTWTRYGYLFAVDLAVVDHRGRRVWTRHVQGRLDVEDQLVTLDNVPLLQDLGHIESKAGVDCLFTLSTGHIIDNSLTRADAASTLGPLGVSPYVPDGDLFSSQAAVVDARNGNLRDIGSAEVGANAVRTLTVTGDFSGDGRDDIVESHPYTNDAIYNNDNAMGDGVVSAIRSSDGTTLWQQVLPSGAIPTQVTPVGNVTGDHSADVVMSLSSSSGGTPQVILVDGSTGAIVWQKPADSVLGIGDVRATGHSDVVLANIDKNTKRTVHLAAVNAAGADMWSSNVALPGGGSSHVVAALLYDAGDLDADRFSDIDVSVFSETQVSSASSFSTHVSVVGIGYVSARSGRVIPRLPNEQAIFATLDGRGDDAVTLYSDGITVRAGNTSKSLWQVDFGRRITWATADSDGVPSRCGNLLVSGFFDDGRTGGAAVAVFDERGRLLWTRAMGVSGVHPRTMTRSYHC